MWPQQGFGGGALGGTGSIPPSPHPYLHLKRFSAPATSASLRQPRLAVSRSSQSWATTSSPSELMDKLQSPILPHGCCLWLRGDRVPAGDGSTSGRGGDGVQKVQRTHLQVLSVLRAASTQLSTP